MTASCIGSWLVGSPGCATTLALHRLGWRADRVGSVRPAASLMVGEHLDIIWLRELNRARECRVEPSATGTRETLVEGFLEQGVPKGVAVSAILQNSCRHCAIHRIEEVRGTDAAGRFQKIKREL